MRMLLMGAKEVKDFDMNKFQNKNFVQSKDEEKPADNEEE